MFPFKPYTGHTFLLLLPVATTFTIPSIHNFTGSSSLALPTNETFTGPALLLNDIPAVTSNLSLDADNAVPVCDGNLLGFDMNRYSCLQAWNRIPDGYEQLTFGDRLNGRFDVQLPRRFSGRECPVLVLQQECILRSIYPRNKRLWLIVKSGRYLRHRCFSQRWCHIGYNFLFTDLTVGREPVRLLCSEGKPANPRWLD